MEPPNRRPGAVRLWDPDLSELTPEGPHPDTVSNPAIGTSEKKFHIPMGMGTWQEWHHTSGRTSENVGIPALRA